jgi:hypothetical protein
LDKATYVSGIDGFWESFKLAVGCWLIQSRMCRPVLSGMGVQLPGLPLTEAELSVESFAPSLTCSINHEAVADPLEAPWKEYGRRL